MLQLWMLTCLLGWASMHATDALTESPQASHKSELRIEKPIAVPIEQPCAFVYNDNAKTKPFIGRFTTKDIYLIGSITPKGNSIIFNSQGPFKKITYDSKTGELIVSEAGTYEVAYAASPVNHAQIALLVNGRQIRQSIVPIGNSLGAKRVGLRTALFILKLNKGDRVGLSVFATSALDRNGGIGVSASLSMTKI